VFDAIHDRTAGKSRRAFVEAPLALRRMPSVQDQAQGLRRQFSIFKKTSSS
jgi:hypothetical protein